MDQNRICLEVVCEKCNLCICEVLLTEEEFQKKIKKEGWRKNMCPKCSKKLGAQKTHE